MIVLVGNGHWAEQLRRLLTDRTNLHQRDVVILNHTSEKSLVFRREEYIQVIIDGGALNDEIRPHIRQILAYIEQSNQLLLKK